MCLMPAASHLFKHNWSQLVLDELLVKLLEEVVCLVAVLPLGHKLVHTSLYARDKDARDLVLSDLGFLLPSLLPLRDEYADQARLLII